MTGADVKLVGSFRARVRTQVIYDELISLNGISSYNDLL
jgi:hypothetical protein